MPLSNFGALLQFTDEHCNCCEIPCVWMLCVCLWDSVRKRGFDHWVRVNGFKHYVPPQVKLFGRSEVVCYFYGRNQSCPCLCLYCVEICLFYCLIHSFIFIIIYFCGVIAGVARVWTAVCGQQVRVPVHVRHGDSHVSVLHANLSGRHLHLHPQHRHTGNSGSHQGRTGMLYFLYFHLLSYNDE